MGVGFEAKLSEKQTAGQSMNPEAAGVKCKMAENVIFHPAFLGVWLSHSTPWASVTLPSHSLTRKSLVGPESIEIMDSLGKEIISYLYLKTTKEVADVEMAYGGRRATADDLGERTPQLQAIGAASNPLLLIPFLLEPQTALANPGCFPVQISLD